MLHRISPPRLVLLTAVLLCFKWSGFLSPAVAADRPPNVVIIYCDDLGYGDLGCFGHPTIATPELDRMAAEGMKLTQFYSAAPVCTPSRAAILTGRLPVRNGMCSNKRRVLFPNSKGGLPAEEITLAEVLKSKGYATACVGKWHLGHREQFLPTNNGFDSYFGIPYSNNMDKTAEAPPGREVFWKPKSEYFNVPLLRDTTEIERPADQTTITRRFTQEAMKFIESNREQPFFLYLAHSMPHVPLFTSEKFAGVSKRGLYGDVIEELDWSVGQVLGSLRTTGLQENTVVFFSSDNGPWLIFNEQGGSAGLLREGKGSTWEGGMREPTIAWWPGTIKPNSVSMQLASTMDIFATACNLAGVHMPQDRTMDSYDLTPVLRGEGEGIREVLFYYRDAELFAVRKGPWKAHYFTRDGYGQSKPEAHNPPLLFNLEIDPSEKYNVAGQHANVLQELAEAVQQHEQELVRVPSQLEL